MSVINFGGGDHGIRDVDITVDLKTYNVDLRDYYGLVSEIFPTIIPRAI
jgi:hypothetical protein